jgi:hypothetical protein
VFLAGCDNGSPGTSTSNSGELDGTWKQGNYEIIINGEDYVMKANGAYYGKGAISYSVANKTFSFRSTHAWTGSGWSPYSETTNGTLEYGGGNTLIISNLDNYNYTSLAGSWTKQTGGGTGNGTDTPPTGNTASKTITVTGFPGSIYSGKFAGIMLSPSVTSLASEEITAIGGVLVTGTSLTFSLYDYANSTTRWNGTGNYIIGLGISNSAGDVEKMFFYSNGAQINSPSDLLNVPEYSITETTSSIPFNKFYDVTDMMQSD